MFQQVFYSEQVTDFNFTCRHRNKAGSFNVLHNTVPFLLLHTSFLSSILLFFCSLFLGTFLGTRLAWNWPADMGVSQALGTRFHFLLILWVPPLVKLYAITFVLALVSFEGQILILISWMSRCLSKIRFMEVPCMVVQTWPLILVFVSCLSALQMLWYCD